MRHDIGIGHIKVTATPGDEIKTYALGSCVAVILYDKKLKIAGTSDCVAEYDGKLSIIDYKTKRSDQKESYLADPFLQCTAYSIMWEEMTGVPINQIVILVSSEKGQLKEFIKDPNDYKEELYDRIKDYYSKS